MAAGAVDVLVAAPPDRVWEKVGDFAGVGELFPAAGSPFDSREMTGSSACSAWRSASACWPRTRKRGC